MEKVNVKVLWIMLRQLFCKHDYVFLRYHSDKTNLIRQFVCSKCKMSRVEIVKGGN